MIKIYQLMVDDKYVCDPHYNKDDATSNAMQIAKDTKESVVIWVAEEIEGIPVDALVWTIYGVVSV